MYLLCICRHKTALKTFSVLSLSLSYSCRHEANRAGWESDCGAKWESLFLKRHSDRQPERLLLLCILPKNTHHRPENCHVRYCQQLYVKPSNTLFTDVFYIDPDQYFNDINSIKTWHALRFWCSCMWAGVHIRDGRNDMVEKVAICCHI